MADDALPTGNVVPDAHLVALMLENDVRTIWTSDRDFRRFRGIEVRDPFEQAAAYLGSSDSFTSWSSETGLGTSPSDVMNSSDAPQPARSIAP